MVRGRWGVACMMLILATCAVQARSVKSVTIMETGKADDPSSGDACQGFVPTPKQVATYFLQAYPIPSPVAMNRYYSPCFARGKVTFSDGYSAKWTLSSSGAAVLNWDEGGDTYLLYRPSPWRDPFGSRYEGEDVGM